MLKPWKRKSIYFKSDKIHISSIVRQILPIALPVGVSSLLNVILRFINSILIPQNLMKIGYSNRRPLQPLGGLQA